MNKYYVPKNEQTINELYAVISVDDDGNEGIVADIAENISLPLGLVFGYKKNIDLIMPLVKKLAKDSGMNMQIVKFSQKEILEIIGE